MILMLDRGFVFAFSDVILRYPRPIKGQCYPAIHLQI